MPSQRVYSRRKRVRFTEKNIGDVGAGTPWPMLVELQEIAMIFGGVKDAWFTSGMAAAATGDPTLAPEFAVSINASTTAPLDRAHYSHIGYLVRGYTTPEVSGTAAVSAHNSAYLGTAYDRGDSDMWRDLVLSERGMWMVEGVDILPAWDGGGGFGAVNAFTFECDNRNIASNTDFFVSDYAFYPPGPPYFPYGGYATVKFSGEIAVVKADPADSMYATTNQFYLGVRFLAQQASEASAVDYILTISTDISYIDGSPGVVCNYKILIPGSTLSCPIYADTSTFPFLFGDDFIHETQALWPSR